MLLTGEPPLPWTMETQDDNRGPARAIGPLVSRLASSRHHLTRDTPPAWAIHPEEYKSVALLLAALW